MTGWTELSRRAGFASHRLVGWIYWDPDAIEGYRALGVPDGLGWYVASRGAPLGDAGNEVVTAAFYSINGDFVAMALDLCRSHTTFSATAAVRDAAVGQGLRTHVPEICDGLAALADPLWAAADQLSPAGRVVFASHRAWPRPDDPLVSAWLAVNCIREWRGDTHWAIHIAEGIGDVASGILDAAWRHHEDDWLPRSRGADDAALADGFAELEARGLAVDGAVTPEAVRFRQDLEDRLDQLCAKAWQHLGEARTEEFLELVEPVGSRLLDRIDQTAGPRWMPAGRER